MPDRRSQLLAIITILAVLTIARLLGAAVVPVAQDEAYYFVWARDLAWGYFDHPPLVALMSWTATWMESNVFVARLGTVVISLASGILSYRLFRTAGLAPGKGALAALVLAHGSLIGLLAGFLTTPDTALLIAWIWAVDEGIRALSGARPRWLVAGLATGIGLLAKYTMVLIGPVYLLGLILRDREGLKSPWPYLGGVVAALVFLPHVLWNAENEWITMRFQLRHGFALERPVVPDGALPEPLPEDPESQEARLAEPFVEIEEAAEKEEKRPAWYDELLAALNRYVGYYASQVAIWGALLWPIGLALKRRDKRATIGSTLTPVGSTMLLLAAAVPLAIFGLLSLGTKVEANWSAMYVIGAAGLAAPLVAGDLRKVLVAAGINLLLLALASWHANTGIFAKRPHRDRVLKETHGYEELAQRASTLDGPVFADSYQLVSMLSFYAPTLTVAQWPGITRHSEFTRSGRPMPWRLSDLISIGHFWLITTDLPPPRIRGFQAASLSQLRDCHPYGLQEISAEQARDPESRCKRPVHEWYLVRYETF